MRVALTFLALLVAGCGGSDGLGSEPAVPPTPAEQPPEPGDPPSLQVLKFLGAERIRIIGSATRIESYRIKPTRAASVTADTIAGYPIVKQGPDLSAAQTIELRRVCLDGKHYLFGQAKRCKFQPGVVLRFHLEPRRLDLLLCFSCDEWQYLLDGTDVHEDFDPARGALLALVKPLFPDDAAIQGLKAP